MIEAFAMFWRMDYLVRYKALLHSGYSCTRLDVGTVPRPSKIEKGRTCQVQISSPSAVTCNQTWLLIQTRRSRRLHSLYQNGSQKSVLVSSNWGFSATETLICILSSYVFSAQVFRNQFENMVESNALLSSQEHVSISKERFERMEVYDADASRPKSVFLRKNRKDVFWEQMEYTRPQE